MKIVWMRSHTGSRMCQPLSGDHLRLCVDFSCDGNLKKLIGPVLIPKLDAFLVVFVVRSRAGTAQPLLIRVPKFLFKVCIFSALVIHVTAGYGLLRLLAHCDQ